MEPGHIAVLSFCLWMAWQPAARTSLSEPSTDRTEASWQPANRPIAEYRVGDAALTDTARGDHDTTFGQQVDPATWKHLVLKASKTDGTTADVEFLRPDWWLKEHQAQVGRTIEISVPECGIEGQAEVLAISNCPELQPTPRGYRTVTGTFRHESAEVIDIHVEGLDEPIGTTAVHPFWSEDRQDYVQAGDLKVGEHLLGDTGRVEITAISPRGPPEPVYNLEVLGDHNYKVTSACLLVHNGNGNSCLFKLDSIGRWRWGFGPKRGRMLGSQQNQGCLHRPTLRQGSENAIRNAHRGTIPSDRSLYDFAHVHGWENRRVVAAGEKLGLTQSQLNDYVNARAVDIFEIQPAGPNRAHVGEKPGNGELGDIVLDMKLFFSM